MEKILEKIKGWLTRDLPWKIAAFLMAFALWFLILNIIDPIRTITVTVPLQLHNENALVQGIHLENIDALRNQEVRIQVRGNSRSVEALRLVAYIDLSTSDIANAANEAGVLNVTIQVDRDFEDDIELLGVRPPNVPLYLDTITTRHIQVEVDPIGEVDGSYIALTDVITITPHTISVTGPRSAVDNIHRLVVEVDLDGLTTPLHKAEQVVRAYNMMNVEVDTDYVQISGTVNVRVPVYRRGRITVLAPEYLGDPPAGFGIYNINWHPRTLDVAGEEEAILNLEPVRLSPIPESLVATATEPFYVPYNFHGYLPPGVFLVEQNLHTIIVDVLVEPIITQEFTINRSNFQIFGTPPYTTILTDEVTLTISGLESVLATIGNIIPIARLGNLNLPEGEHEIPFSFSGIPQRANIMGTPPRLTIYIGNPEGGNNGEEAEEESEEGTGETEETNATGETDENNNMGTGEGENAETEPGGNGD